MGTQSGTDENVFRAEYSVGTQLVLREHLPNEFTQSCEKILIGCPLSSGMVWVLGIQKEQTPCPHGAHSPVQESVGVLEPLPPSATTWGASNNRH